MKTAVVLAAGGVVGQAFHLGVLGCLAEAVGFDARRADVLVGSSAGSLVAAGLAGGLSAADLRAEMLGEPLSPEGRAIRGTRRAMPRMPTPEPLPARRGPLAASALLHAARRPWAVRPGALASSLLPPGQVGTDLIARSVQHLHGSAWPDRDLRITAVRARDSQRVVFGPFDNIALGGATVEGVTLVDLRAELNNIAGSRFGVAIGATNLLDEFYTVGNSGTLSFGIQGTSIGAPRLIYGEVSYRF